MQYMLWIVLIGGLFGGYYITHLIIKQYRASWQPFLKTALSFTGAILGALGAFFALLHFIG
ncbi:MAG: hypothetical protein JXA19_03385 [Anaerolineales bacterium]|nr:hypothetical protein [Anaerolineales bacterium]